MIDIYARLCTSLINKSTLSNISMAKTCDLCGRGSTKDASRSHSNIKTIKRQNINLQTKNMEGASLKMCAKCLKTLNSKFGK